MKVWIFAAAALVAAQWSFAASAQEAPARAAAASASQKMDTLKKEKGKDEPTEPTVQRMSWGTRVLNASADEKAAAIDKTTTGSIEKSVKQSAKGKATKLATGHRYTKIVARYASEYGVSAALADAVIRIESNYRVDARGSHGEIGLMQIKPSTARMLGYSGSAKGLYDPETNIKYGMKYLAMADDLGDGSTCGTILKYNAGHAATHMNPVSKRYCGRVMAYLES